MSVVKFPGQMQTIDAVRAALDKNAGSRLSSRDVYTEAMKLRTGLRFNSVRICLVKLLERGEAVRTGKGIHTRWEAPPRDEVTNT